MKRTPGWISRSMGRGLTKPSKEKKLNKIEAIIRPEKLEAVKEALAEQGFVGNHEEMMPVIFSQGIKAVTEIGVVGGARKAEAGKGEEYLELWADKMVDFVRKKRSTFE